MCLPPRWRRIRRTCTRPRRRARGQPVRLGERVGDVLRDGLRGVRGGVYGAALAVVGRPATCHARLGRGGPARRARARQGSYPGRAARPRAGCAPHAQEHGVPGERRLGRRTRRTRRVAGVGAHVLPLAVPSAPGATHGAPHRAMVLCAGPPWSPPQDKRGDHRASFTRKTWDPGVCRRSRPLIVGKGGCCPPMRLLRSPFCHANGKAS